MASKILWRSSFTVSPSKMAMGYFVPFHSTSIASSATGKEEDDDEQEEEDDTTTWTSITPTTNREMTPDFSLLFQISSFLGSFSLSLVRSGSVAPWPCDGDQACGGLQDEERENGVRAIERIAPRPQTEKVAQKNSLEKSSEKYKEKYDQTLYLSGAVRHLKPFIYQLSSSR